MDNGGAFSMKNSLATKGVAILMMMWHHCFLSGRFENYTINFWPLPQSQVVNIAAFCKICVSLFAFVSGYGLYLSYQKVGDRGRRTTGWIIEKLIRTLSGYWFVLIPAWIICSILDGRPYQVYGFEGSPFLGLWNMGIEFLGLTNLTGGRLLDSTWWYMSAAIAFIILLPLICEGLEKVGCFCTVGTVFLLTRLLVGYPGDMHLLSFLPIFCFGAVFAKYNLFGWWTQFWGRQKGKTAIIIAKFVVMLFLLGVAYLSRRLATEIWWDVKWSIFPLAVILFLYDYIFTCPVLNQALTALGRHATNIFLIHSFFRAYYANAFIYSMGHFALIIAVLLAASLVCSFAVELLKKAVHYETGINRLICALQKLRLSG